MRQSIYGISFDGLASSGVTAEFFKLCKPLRQRGWDIYLDPGFQIKCDKRAFTRHSALAADRFPAWCTPDTVLWPPPDEYSESLVEELLAFLADRPRSALPRGIAEIAQRLSGLIARRLVRRWTALRVAVVVVENGSLPENIVVSDALYQAIGAYGTRKGAGKFVLWRDHDLMWFSEPEKYGPYSLENAPLPRHRRFIQHAVITQAALSKWKQWAPHTDAVCMPNRFGFRPVGDPKAKQTRKAQLGYRPDAPLIFRASRLIPQKRVDREVHLLAAINSLRAGEGLEPACLALAGAEDEAPAETARLRAICADLRVAPHVRFLGAVPNESSSATDILDLTQAADLCSFMTSWNYEGYGNPPGEAIGCGTPFLSSTYRLFADVYGRLDIRCFRLETAEHDDGLPTPELAAAVHHAVKSPKLLHDMAKHNWSAAFDALSASRGVNAVDELFPQLARPLVGA
jgi:glycosyltransferase involved in cell wall biosynthesis